MSNTGENIWTHLRDWMKRCPFQTCVCFGRRLLFSDFFCWRFGHQHHVETAAKTNMESNKWWFKVNEFPFPTDLSDKTHQNVPNSVTFYHCSLGQTFPTFLGGFVISWRFCPFEVLLYLTHHHNLLVLRSRLNGRVAKPHPPPPPRVFTASRSKDVIPRCSMYGIFTYIWSIFMVNVWKCR